MYYDLAKWVGWSDQIGQDGWITLVDNFLINVRECMHFSCWMLKS